MVVAEGLAGKMVGSFLQMKTQDETFDVGVDVVIRRESAIEGDNTITVNDFHELTFGTFPDGRSSFEYRLCNWLLLNFVMLTMMLPIPEN